MTDWNDFQTAIPAAVKKLLGKKYDVDWFKRGSRWRDAEHCRLSVTGIVHLGRGEVRRSATDPADGTFTERIYTPSRIVVQFLFIAQNQELALSAIPPAETVRAALRRSDAFDILTAAEIGISQIESANVVDLKDDDDRWRSGVVFDVWFNSHVSEVTRTAAGDYVEQVEITGEVDSRPVTVLVDAS